MDGWMNCDLRPFKQYFRYIRFEQLQFHDTNKQTIHKVYFDNSHFRDTVHCLRKDYRFFCIDHTFYLASLLPFYFTSI